MDIINTHEAKTHFSRLLSAAEHGREVIIGRHGTPVAKLVPIKTRLKKRLGGQLKGRVHISESFDTPETMLDSDFVNTVQERSGEIDTLRRNKKLLTLAGLKKA